MAQGEKRENSVLFSLRELRQIEESRVQEEEHAVRSAEEARLRAQQEAEQRARNEEESRVRAERDHQRSIEEARVTAEREARMRVEASEAAERARHQGELERSRMEQEMDLRRAEVAKKRPTWMLVVTGFALIAAVALIFFAIQKMQQSDEDTKKKEIAEHEAQTAVNQAKDAQDKLDKVTKDLEDLNDKVGTAVNAVVAAQNDADRASAKSKLLQLQQEQADMRARVQAAKDAAALAVRKAGVKTSDECKNNPLAKGCM
jgi:hypothetical protein